MLDHYMDGKTVFSQQQKADFAPGQKLTLEWKLPALEPGFYYATFSSLKDGQPITQTRQYFAVNLTEYSHALTRPADFEAFWKQKLEQMRAIPFDETAVKNTDKSTKTYTIYDVKIAGFDGQPVEFELSMPNSPGPHMYVSNSKQPDLHARIRFAQGRYYPEEGTYRTWNSVDDNNLLDVILYFRRLADYLVQRDDISGLYLVGASRTGPVQFICAALDPTKIMGVDILVPCPVGMSWDHPRYRGWGGKPADVSWENYLKMAAYVDAANHAPDMKVPFIVGYGMLDDLAPPQGIEAMFKHATQSPWKRISRDGGGHQSSEGYKSLQDELEKKLGIQGAVQTDESILTDH